ncbi:MaoC family dehydratase [Saccharolobus islandicus]|uniref:MaoC domain protein dehydratase n=1 Tax=Saccharolobus islandicus (strain M.16.27) TaxID=427318 RepID=C3N471_SACI3|nr:MaoC/PaaZ C-terminal domain-containing protein [Sulfolobus islandicus]ACP54803.1 MaoC domain protein dehydratase [Sulfolobus islandicus M.16.27]
MEYKVGYKFTTKRRTITDADIILFAGLTGDWHPAHLDDIYAKNSIFGKRVIHGLLTLSILQGLLAQHRIVEDIIALLGINNVKFKSPVFIGDTIWSECEITDSRESKNKPGNLIVTIHCIGRKQDNTEVLEYDIIELMRL